MVPREVGYLKSDKSNPLQFSPQDLERLRKSLSNPINSGKYGNYNSAADDLDDIGPYVLAPETSVPPGHESAPDANFSENWVPASNLSLLPPVIPHCCTPRLVPSSKKSGI